MKQKQLKNTKMEDYTRIKIFIPNSAWIYTLMKITDAIVKEILLFLDLKPQNNSLELGLS
jgi:hypothetical protein